MAPTETSRRSMVIIGKPPLRVGGRLAGIGATGGVYDGAGATVVSTVGAGLLIMGGSSTAAGV